jgi:hypothetical protein
MDKIMRRGKRQILFSYLPGKTFAFGKTSEISIIKTIRGDPRTDVSLDFVLNAIEDYARSWRGEFRPALNNNFSKNYHEFILIDPTGAEAEMFPLIFWCQDHDCSRVFDFSNKGLPNSSICPMCKKGKLTQLRWIKFHRCGALQPLRPPFCKRCRSSENIALDIRGSEKISNFRWICKNCGLTFGFFAGRCNECNWTEEVPSQADPRNMVIEVYRASRTFYPHYVVLLNPPKKEMRSFLSLKEWPELAAASLLKLPEMSGKNLLDFESSGNSLNGAFQISQEQIEELRKKGHTEEQIGLYLQMQEDLMGTIKKKNEESSPQFIASKLIQRTGIDHDTYENISREILESVMPLQGTSTKELKSSDCLSKLLGFSNISLINDFPIMTATFGYTRDDYRPNLTRLNPFPPDKRHKGKFPIFVDTIEADSIIIKLDPIRVLSWIEYNGHKPELPPGSDNNLIKNAYFFKLFNEISLGDAIHAIQPEARLVFGLLHTMSHLCIRQAAFICGLDHTRLSEYILPRTLTFAIYCNHRFGATIGALTSLFEQSIEEWLTKVKDTYRCVYDPICLDNGANCHACTHLAETSCRYFNQNLSRAFLYGGNDAELGDIKGYFKFSEAA